MVSELPVPLNILWDKSLSNTLQWEAVLKSMHLIFMAALRPAASPRAAPAHTGQRNKSQTPSAFWPPSLPPNQMPWKRSATAHLLAECSAGHHSSAQKPMQRSLKKNSKSIHSRMFQVSGARSRPCVYNGQVGEGWHGTGLGLGDLHDGQWARNYGALRQ